MSEIRTEMGWSSTTSIQVQGVDLVEDIIGKVDLGQFAFFEILGRLPSAQESTVFNAMLSTLVEHGLTPGCLAARLTYCGAPESLQAAVAAGVLGMGSKFAGTSDAAAKLLQSHIGSATSEQELRACARGIVEKHVASKTYVPGLGHNVHKPVDPRAVKLFELAQHNGMSGHYVTLMKLISLEAEIQFNRPGDLPVNATGAIAALACELQIPWQLCRGLAVIGRAIGVVGHLAEEMRNPIAYKIWRQVEEDATAHHRR
ncbi:citryl-CoA lyase [Variovorax paradoxus]